VCGCPTGSGGRQNVWVPVIAVFLSAFEKTMEKRPPEVIYQGVWQGFGKMYNIKVEDGYTTIIVKPGEDLKQRSKETKEKFFSQA
jgi:hypothetical protein